MCIHDKTKTVNLVLCPGHTFTDHLAGSTTDWISRMTPEMPISVVWYGCTIYIWLSTTTYDYGFNTESFGPIRIATNVHPWLIRRPVRECVTWALGSHSKWNGFQDRFLLYAGQKYCRMLQWGHSAILSTFIMLPFFFKTFVLSIFEWPLKTGLTEVCLWTR